MTNEKKLEVYRRLVENLKGFDWDAYGETAFIDSDREDEEYFYAAGVKDAIDDVIWHAEADLA